MSWIPEQVIHPDSYSVNNQIRAIRRLLSRGSLQRRQAELTVDFYQTLNSSSNHIAANAIKFIRRKCAIAVAEEVINPMTVRRANYEPPNVLTDEDMQVLRQLADISGHGLRRNPKKRRVLVNYFFEIIYPKIEHMLDDQ